MALTTERIIVCVDRKCTPNMNVYVSAYHFSIYYPESDLISFDN